MEKWGKIKGRLYISLLVITMKKVFLVIISLLVSLFWSGIITISFANWEISTNTWIRVIDDSIASKKEAFNLNWENIEKLFEKYLENKKDNADRWLTFMTILSTIFAVFFVYSWFKIDSIKEEIYKTKKEMEDIKQESINDLEFSNQLKYAIQYMMSKQYQKAIDALIVLRSEHFTLKDSGRLNSCYYFLAICFYEQWIKDNDIEDIAKAVEFINEAIEDANHPLKLEIIEKFNQMDLN